MSDQDETRHIPSGEDLAAARERVEALLSNINLSDEALWAQPPAGFEERVVAAAAAGGAGGAKVSVLRLRPSARRRWWAAAGVAAAAAAVIVAVAVRPASPDWEVDLGATSEAAGVTAAAVRGWNESSGTRVSLAIEGLPTAPPGFVYELWFTKGPVHISAGTFRDPVDVTLWVGVSRADYPRLWITLEPLDDDPGPGVNLLDTDI